MPNTVQVREKSSSIAQNTKAVIWALLASACFATVAAMAKVAVQDYHVLQILFFRQIVVLLSTLPSVAKSFPGTLRTQRPLLHACRLIGAFVALSCGIWAVAVLPLTTAITLSFTQVLFVALLALYFLGESVGLHRFAAILAGFAGVIVVMRPGADGVLDFLAFIPVTGALGAAVAVIAVRTLSQTESTATLLVYQALFVGVLAGVPLFWLWVPPDLPGLLFLLSMGGLATVGQWVGVKALRLGEASVVSNVTYTQLVFGALLGYLLFGEIPHGYTTMGAAIIIGSSVYLLHREARSAARHVD